MLKGCKEPFLVVGRSKFIASSPWGKSLTVLVKGTEATSALSESPLCSFHLHQCHAASSHPKVLPAQERLVPFLSCFMWVGRSYFISSVLQTCSFLFSTPLFLKTYGYALFVLLNCTHLWPEARPWCSQWNWILPHPMVNLEVIRDSLCTICPCPYYFHGFGSSFHVSELISGTHPLEFASRSPRDSIHCVLLCHTHGSCTWTARPHCHLDRVLVLMSLTQENVNWEMSLSGKLLQILTIRGEQNCKSCQEEAQNTMWQKEEKEEPSGKMNITSPHNVPDQTCSPHRMGLSCESCLSDGRSFALPESHTGMSLSTLSATARFWVQIFWSVPEMETRMMDRDWNVFPH